MKREELIAKLKYMDDGDIEPTYERIADFVISDRARLLAEVEDASKPLMEYRSMCYVDVYKAEKAIYDTLEALDKLKDGNQ